MHNLWEMHPRSTKRLLLHRATAACMTNQIKFILNHIATHPEYMDGTGLFKAFQENQATVLCKPG